MSKSEPAFSIERDHFWAMLERAGPALATSDVVPVLKNFFLKIESDRLTVVATDLAFACISSTPHVKVIHEGEITLPGAALRSLVHESDPTQEIHLATSLGHANITSGEAVWTLQSSKDEYPKLPQASTELVDVDAVQWRSALLSVRSAVSDSVMHPSLRMIDINEGRIRASDGFRIHQVLHPFPFNVSIPSEAVAELVHILKGSVVPTQVGVTETHSVVRQGGDYFLIARPTTQFADLDGLLLQPALTNNRQRLTVDREPLIHAVRRVRVVADPDSSALRIDVKKDEIRLSTKDPTGNQASESLPALWSGNLISLNVNHSHLMNLLEIVEDSTITFYLGKRGHEGRSPILVKEDDRMAVLHQLRAWRV